eukprot:50775_1
MLYDKTFRIDSINTLAQQIYDFDFSVRDQWKELVGTIWTKISEKNVFVDKSLRRFNGLDSCKKGCKRTVNPSKNKQSGNAFDTCCALCATNKDPKEHNLHSPGCEKRYHNQFRVNIRDEALKIYLQIHPLTKIVTTTEDNEEKQGLVARKVPDVIPDRNEMVELIKKK